MISSLILLLVVSVSGTFLYSNALTMMGNQENFLRRDLRIELGKAQERIRIVSALGSVSLDLVQKIEANLLMRSYEGFSGAGRIKGPH